jgi:hypothetical protein
LIPARARFAAKAPAGCCGVDAVGDIKALPEMIQDEWIFSWRKS